jgi:cytoskeletal protein RodZ
MDEASEEAGDGPTTVGARLRTAREVRGQTLEDVARQTRVPVRHLVQIEAGRLEGLPAAPYSSGFVKAYARAVDLDPAELSQQFRAEFADATRATPRIAYEPYEPADPTRLPPRLLAIVALAIAVLLVAGYGIWRSGVLSGEGPDARAKLAANGESGAPVDNTTAPNVTPAVSAPASAPTGAVRLTALQPVWFKVSERSGPTLFMGTLDQGKSYDVPATANDPVIRTGRPEALQVTVGGQQVAPLGQPAHTISNVSLKAAALTAPAGTATAAVPPAAATAPTLNSTAQQNAD